MTKLYRVRGSACKDGGYASSIVEIHGWLWVYEYGGVYHAVATGGMAGWFEHELEEVSDD